MSTGALWLEFLRFYTEKFCYDEHIVTIRQIEPLLRRDKGWFRKTIAVEDPFELTHNLTGGLHMKSSFTIEFFFGKKDNKTFIAVFRLDDDPSSFDQCA